MTGVLGDGQRVARVEYKKESFGLCQEIARRIKDRVGKDLWKREVATQEQASEEAAPQPVRTIRRPEAPRQNLNYSAPAKEAAQPIKRREAKVGRNDPCPCGSGKKYKKCHGATAA